MKPTAKIKCIPLPRLTFEKAEKKINFENKTTKMNEKEWKRGENGTNKTMLGVKLMWKKD